MEKTLFNYNKRQTLRALQNLNLSTGENLDSLIDHVQKIEFKEVTEKPPNEFTQAINNTKYLNVLTPKVETGKVRKQ
jgi:hypothetical protein